MRDNREGLPELIDAVERDGKKFGIAQVVIDGQAHAFEFGVNPEEFSALRRILQLYPFENRDVGAYRYFFVPSVRRLSPENEEAEFSVRVEQGQEGRQFKVSGPNSLVAHLLWFSELQSTDAASHLRRVDPRPEV